MRADSERPAEVFGMRLKFANAHERNEQMKNILMRLWKEEEGQDLIEYVLLVSLIALVVAAAFPPLTTAISNVFTVAGTCLGGGSCKI